MCVFFIEQVPKTTFWPLWDARNWGMGWVGLPGITEGIIQQMGAQGVAQLSGEMMYRV